jgi:uncharacterized membrane protein YdbT with pleckstrin-like domain
VNSYVDQTLISDEKVTCRAKVSKWSLVPLIVAGIILLPLVGIGIVCWVWAFVVYTTTELAVTDKRVIAKTGLVRRRTIEMFLEKVESVQVDQSVLGRIFNYGSVTISGTGTHSAPFHNISDPLVFRKNFMAAAESRRN